MDEKELAAYEAGKKVGEYIGFNKCLKLTIIILTIFTIVVMFSIKFN